MASIEHRLKKLEESHFPRNDLIVYFINLQGENIRAYRSGDKVIERRPEETVLAFEERIKQECLSNYPGNFAVFQSVRD